jgi:hypothetical protein
LNLRAGSSPRAIGASSDWRIMAAPPPIQPLRCFSTRTKIAHYPP